MKKQILVTLILPVMLLSTSSVVAENFFNVSIGYEQTSGNYGLENDTDITTIPLNLQYINDAWRFRLSIPHISVSGDGSIIPGSNGTIDTSISPNGRGSGANSTASLTTTETLVETQSGLGDIISSLSYAFLPDINSYMFYELTAEVKWGTASASKNLGTGENDYSLDLYSVYEKNKLKPFLSVGYLVMGDSEIEDYNDVFFASTGLMYPLNNKTLLNVAYDYQQTTIDGTDDGHTVNFYISRQLSQKWAANFYLLNGLSDSVADTGIGFTIIKNL